MRFPRLERYIEGLPEGLASYPAYKAKATIVRALSDEMALEPSRLDGAPQELRALVAEPPPATAWIRESVVIALHFACADAAGLPHGKMLERIYATSKRMIDSPMYRILAKVASPNLLLRGAELSWLLLHRGVTLDAELGDHTARITTRHPPHLWTSLVHEGVGVGFRAVIESAGGTNVGCSVLRSEPEMGVFELRWE